MGKCGQTVGKLWANLPTLEKKCGQTVGKPWANLPTLEKKCGQVCPQFAHTFLENCGQTVGKCGQMFLGFFKCVIFQETDVFLSNVARGKSCKSICLLIGDHFSALRYDRM